MGDSVLHSLNSNAWCKLPTELFVNQFLLYINKVHRFLEGTQKRNEAAWNRASWQLCFEPSGRKHDLPWQNSSGGSDFEALLVKMWTLSSFLPQKVVTSGAGMARIKGKKGDGFLLGNRARNPFMPSDPWGRANDTKPFRIPL